MLAAVLWITNSKVLWFRQESSPAKCEVYDIYVAKDSICYHQMCKCAEHITSRQGLMAKEQAGWDKAGERKLLLLSEAHTEGPESILTQPEMGPAWTSALWSLRGLAGGLFSIFFWEQFVKGQKYQQKTIINSTSFKLHLPPQNKKKIKKSRIMPMRSWGLCSTLLQYCKETGSTESERRPAPATAILE